MRELKGSQFIFGKQRANSVRGNTAFQGNRRCNFSYFVDMVKTGLFFEEGPLYFLREAWLGDLFSRESWFKNLFIRDSWLKMARSFHVHVNEFFIFCVTREWTVELNVIREPFCFAWWISFYFIVFKMYALFSNGNG